MSLIKVLMKNDIHKTPRYILESMFDKDTMDRLDDDTEEQKIKASSNLKEMLKEQKAPGLLSSRSSNTKSMYYNNKLDSGAVGDFLDAGLDGAKKIDDSRNKKMGFSFRKNKILKRRKRK